MFRSVYWMLVIVALANILCIEYEDVVAPIFRGDPIVGVPVCKKCGQEAVPHSSKHGIINGSWKCQHCNTVFTE